MHTNSLIGQRAVRKLICGTAATHLAPSAEMQPPKFARHIPLAHRNTLILLFVELRMIRLTLLVVAAVCVVYP
ncbi:MAG: hypothetical protein ACERIL_05550, partial [Hyphomicrobium sp.]